MNKEKAKTVSDAILKALASVEAEFDVKIAINGGSFDESTFTPKVVVSDVVDGKAVTPELTALRALHPELEGKEITLSGKVYAVEGYRLRAPKRPFVLRPLAGGKSVVCTPEPVLAAA